MGPRAPDEVSRSGRMQPLQKSSSLAIRPSSSRPQHPRRGWSRRTPTSLGTQRSSGPRGTCSSASYGQPPPPPGVRSVGGQWACSPVKDGLENCHCAHPSTPGGGGLVELRNLVGNPTKPSPAHTDGVTRPVCEQAARDRIEDLLLPTEHPPQTPEGRFPSVWHWGPHRSFRAWSAQPRPWRPARVVAILMAM